MDVFYGIALSLHLGLENDYNEVHPYIGTYLDKNYNWSVGTYYNSEENISGFVSYAIDISPTKWIELGLVTGYSSGDVLPMVKYNYNNFFIAPVIENEETLGAVVGVDWRF